MWIIQVREVFESSIAFGRAALEELGIDPETAAATANDVRKRDTARLILQKARRRDGRRGAGGRREDRAGAAGGARRARPAGLNAETRDILGEGVVLMDRPSGRISPGGGYRRRRASSSARPCGTCSS